MNSHHRSPSDRLREMGRQPVDPVVRSQHLTAAAAAPSRPPRRFSRLAVAAAALAGFALGSTGLAAAGALPDTAQDVAHDVLAVVKVNVPEGNRGQCISAAARANPDDEAAKQTAKAACARGGPAGNQGSKGTGSERPQQTPGATDGDPCTGPPAWAGRASGPTVDEKDQHRAQRSGCAGAEGTDTEPAEPAERTEASETTEPPVTTQTTETTESTQPPVTTQTTETTESTQPPVTTQTTETTEPTETTTSDAGA